MHVGAAANSLVPQPPEFTNCPILYPTELPTATFPAFGSPLPIAELFASGKEIVLYHHRSTDHAPAGSPPFTTSSLVNWQVTFVRIR